MLLGRHLRGECGVEDDALDHSIPLRYKVCIVRRGSIIERGDDDTSLRTLCAAIVLVIGFSSAAHASRAQVSIDPDFVFGKWFNVPPGESFWCITDSVGSADPVMHLWDYWQQQELLYADDFYGNDSFVYYQNNGSSYKNLYLLVRAKNASSQGATTITCDIDYASITEVYSNVPLEGTLRYVSSGSSNAYETAMVPGGIVNTMLLGLDSSGHLRGFDLNGGVGNMSLIYGVSGISRVIVSESMYGYGPTIGAGKRVSLYVNDRHSNHDADSDGLGYWLENAIGSCDSATGSVCGGVSDPADSDNDGIEDAYEIFGRDVPGPYDLRFPEWGSSVTQKDIFIEADYRAQNTTPQNQTQDFASNPFLYPYMTANDRDDLFDGLRLLYGDGLPQIIGNIDGTSGVRVHFDIGARPLSNSDLAPGEQYGDLAVYGDFGDGGDLVPSWKNRDLARQQHSSEYRDMYFRYWLVLSETGGQAAGITFHGGRGVSTVAHELGHSIGLGHGGSDAINCKPHYQSLMNYAYGGSRFSWLPVAPITILMFSLLSTR